MSFDYYLLQHANLMLSKITDYIHIRFRMTSDKYFLWRQLFLATRNYIENLTRTGKTRILVAVIVQESRQVPGDEGHHQGVGPCPHQTFSAGSIPGRCWPASAQYRAST